ncbi:MAG: CPBP family glutamic-type intramembrane protease, partial [Ignavibacteria bacterium]|nr:CPBP family glutamic-type intramembrane protease [Ignavibacteria bacterium]
MNEFNKQIRLLYSKWSKLKPLKFIIVTTILSLILMIPIALVIDLLNVGEVEIGGLNTEKYSYLGLFVLVVIAAPLIETIVFQLFPIKLIQKLLNNRFNLFPILISSILFSLAHYVYSVWYSLLILPLGFLLAQTYLIFQKRKES